MSEGIKGAKVLLTTCSDCKKEENILFLADQTGLKIAMVMWEAAEEFPNRSIVLMNDATRHGENPNPIAAASMQKADVIFACTRFSMFHAQARRDAVANGARFVNMADYDLEMMERGGVFCDYALERRRCAKMAEHFSGGRRLELTTECGSRLVCSIEGRKPRDQYGVSLEPGVSSSPPDIECATCAVEETAEGVLFIDASIPHPKLGLISEPIKLTIEKGMVRDIEGGKQAEALKAVLEECHDPAVYNVGEIGVGINSSGILNGKMLSDEGCGGTAHIGLGDNVGFGGVVSSSTHLDCIFHKPTIKVDGKTVLEKGEIIFD
ncbi:MAG: aminopeptidase [Oscillospiraceae bacterium]|nr:aminopeptidase [Oscillospiraceae bacterium]